MRKTIFTLCLLLVWSLAVVGQTESTSSATITFFRTPASLLSGKFSISDGYYVRFAKGNLQYQASLGIWRFAENQWEVIGSAAGNTTTGASRSVQSDWIDLFGWATSGWSGSGTNYQPWTVDATDNSYGPAPATLPAGKCWAEVSTVNNCDWGVYVFNAGPNNGYYTLSKAEWEFILTTRTNASNLCGTGKLFGVNGMFLLPDSWSWSGLSSEMTAAGFTWTPAASTTDFAHNIIQSTSAGEALWNKMQTNGVVFLPCTGYKEGGTSTVNAPLLSFFYWTSTAASATNAYALRYLGSTLSYDASCPRSSDYAVRLVQAFGKP